MSLIIRLIILLLPAPPWTPDTHLLACAEYSFAPSRKILPSLPAPNTHSSVSSRAGSSPPPTSTFPTPPPLPAPDTHLLILRPSAASARVDSPAYCLRPILTSSSRARLSPPPALLPLLIASARGPILTSSTHRLPSTPARPPPSSPASYVSARQ